MRNIFKKGAFFIFAFTLFYGCMESPVPIPDFEIPKTNRVVLLEDLTGVRCPNCPKGAAAIEDLIRKFPGKIAAVGVHGAFLTKPLPESKYDFRTPKAIELEKLLEPYQGKPAAHINRVLFPDELFRAVDAVELWEGYVIKELSKEQTLDIKLSTTYDESKRLIDLDCRFIPLLNENGDFNVNVFITESKIEDPQETQGSIIEAYEHNHVFRDAITSISGDILTSNFQEGKSLSKKYSYTIPPDYNPAHIEVVVFVTRNSIDDKSVVQAQTIKIK